MNTLTDLLYGLSVALQPMNLLYCFIGAASGAIVGALPGLGPSAGTAILLPLTFGMNPTSGIIMLCGMYYGCMYGGGITAILLGIPGDSAAVATTFDGYPMNKQQKRPGAALGTSFLSSFIGGTLCIILFTFLAPALARYTLTFGPPEYFALMLMGLTMVSALTGDNPIKGYISAALGLAFSCVGADLVAGTFRYTFHQVHLIDGIDFVCAAMGLFGIAEIVNNSIKDGYGDMGISKEDVKLSKMFPRKNEWKYLAPSIGSGSLIGFFIGMLPGAGATIASFLSYGLNKRTSPRGEEFGTGVPEGIACCESANNAASIGAMVPMLTLGVPGSGATAVMMGALMMFSMTPGPLMFQNNKDFIWGLTASMYVGNFAIFLLCMLTAIYMVKILQIPIDLLNAVVMAFIFIGAFSLENSLFNVGLTIFFGVLGYLMKKMQYPAAPFVLSLVLGNLFEKNLRQSLILSNNSFAIFFNRPISAAIMAIVIIVVLRPILMKLVRTVRKTS
ncbi:MAG: tripartite tricarboxylate transporter permease [Firmicutes bacterium]|nr:tripartite tricarboxylate transporter permease [Bacillota bacterium]